MPISRTVRAAFRGVLAILLSLPIFSWALVPTGAGYYSNWAPYISLGPSNSYPSPTALCNDVVAGMYAHNDSDWKFELTAATFINPYIHYPEPQLGGCFIQSYWRGRKASIYYYTVYYPGQPVCPVNSMRVDGGCTCNPGFQEDATHTACEAAADLAVAVAAPPFLAIREKGAVNIWVTRNGAAEPGRQVTASVTSGALEGCSGVTNGNGVLSCVYTAPGQPDKPEITAECSGCKLPATTSVWVKDDPMPESCQAGSMAGNPIFPSTGEKRQVEHDSTDLSPHPLSLSRSYRSWWAIRGVDPLGAAGLGPAWTHNHAASLFADFAPVSGFDALGSATAPPPNRVVVQTESGDSYFFWAFSAGWQPETGSTDSLVQDSTGWSFRRSQDETTWRFGVDGLPRTRTQRNGWTYVYSYLNGRLAQVENAFGRKLLFNYNAGGQLATAALPGGQTISYSYGAGSRLASVSYPTGSQRQYLYEDQRWPRALTGIVDENGSRLASFAYDAWGRAVATEYAGGANRFAVSYPAGSAATITDPLDMSRTYSYVRAGGKLVVAGSTAMISGGADDARAREQSAIGLVLSEIDFLGVQTLYAWDFARQLKTSETKAAGRAEAQTISTEWHPVFRSPVLVTEAGRTIAYTYDNLGNTLSRTVTDTATGQARTWGWTYDDKGLAATMTEPKGGVWRYTYDAAGNRTSVKNPLGHQTAYSYDAAGRVLTETEPSGLVTNYGYDARGRLVSHSRGEEVSGFAYTPSGQLSRATLPNGYQVSYSYDAAQRLTGATDNRGNSVTYTLDDAGNRLREEVKDASGAIALVTGRIINNLNKVAAVQGSVGQTTAFAYDANGDLVSHTDPLNQTTRQSLDGLRRPTDTTFPDNSSVRQAWSQLDQLTRVTDPKGVQTIYETDAFGDVVREISPDIGAMSYGRDVNGDVVVVQDAKGSISAITRDALGRPIEIRHALDHVAYFSYDQGQAGYLDKFEDKSGSTRYERDLHGRITTKIQAVNDNLNNPTQLKVGYGHQGAELASITYPSGLKVFYRRTAGRITGIDVQEPAGASGKTPAVTHFVTDLAHTALGQPRNWSWKNGDTASRSFDADGRMTQSEIASYSYDAASRITGITQSLWAQRTVTAVVNGTSQTVTEQYQTPVSWTAGYDVRNRLTRFARAGASTVYSYDANSNRLTAIEQTTSEVDLEGAFDQPNFTQSTSQDLTIEAASNKLLGLRQTVTRTQAGGASSSVTSQVNYILDANGAMTSDGLRTFEYDESRRLAKVKLVKDGEAAAVEYLHNALGQRVFKSEPKIEQTLPNEEELGPGFINWLRRQFGWLFTQGNAPKASIGMSFVYDEDARTCSANTTTAAPPERAEPNTSGCPPIQGRPFPSGCTGAGSSTRCTAIIWVRRG